jgi:hypothetical protein
MGSVLVKPEAASRSIGMVRTAMWAITSWLDDPAIVEVMLNPDGRLWIDRLAGGLSDTGKRLSAQDGERFVRVVAQHRSRCTSRPSCPYTQRASKASCRRSSPLRGQTGQRQASSTNAR